MDNILKDILNYIDYLEKTYSLRISIHVRDDCKKYIYYEKQPNNMPVLAPYAYESVAWIDKSMAPADISNLATDILEHCKQYKSFMNECFGGHREYVLSIARGDETVGFVNVNNYPAPQMPKSHGLEVNPCDTPISKKLLDMVIPPLARMIELLFSISPEVPDDNFRKLYAYVSEYHTKATLEMICNEFNFSRSYVSHLFKANTGLSIKSFCNVMKINDAKNMLKRTNLSVTDIAYEVGFNDLSYFISTFKKQVGMTPNAYRREKNFFQ